MNGEPVEGWEIPTYSVIAEEELILGIRRKHLLIILAVSALPSQALLFYSTFTHQAAPFIASIVLIPVVASITLATFRFLCKCDPFWIEHLTTHKIPATRFYS